jgi:hypothetical protein
MLHHYFKYYSKYLGSEGLLVEFHPNLLAVRSEILLNTTRCLIYHQIL